MQATCILCNVVPRSETHLYFLFSINCHHIGENLPKYGAKDFQCIDNEKKELFHHLE